jgi:hypothetical protein
MTLKNAIILTVILSACKTPVDKGNSFLKNDTSTALDFTALNIPKHWTEITRNDSNWRYWIPCPNIRNLMTIELTTIDNKPAISCDFGTDGQWFAIKGIERRGDSILFNTVLPFDTTEKVMMSMKYLDRKKEIAQWITDAGYFYFVNSADTGKFSKHTEPCDTLTD